MRTTTGGCARPRNTRRRNDTALLPPSSPGMPMSDMTTSHSADVQQFGESLGVGRLPDDLDFRCGLQQSRHADANTVVVVRHDNADFVCHCFLDLSTGCPIRDVLPQAAPIHFFSPRRPGATSPCSCRCANGLRCASPTPRHARPRTGTVPRRYLTKACAWPCISER